MDRLRTAVLPWLATLAGVAVLVIAVVEGGKPLKLAVVLLSGVSIVVATRVSIPMFGVFMVVMFAFTASWDNATLAGVHPRLAFLMVGVIALGFGHALKHPPLPPAWLHGFALSALAVTMAQMLFPVAHSYIENRYANSAFGQSLGERGGTLPSVLSLMLNTYVVPMAVVMACTYTSKALRWIIGAYVAGVALSSVSAYLGFIGFPVLLDLFGTPFPPHVRAIGFTSFPLRLGTTIVFALPFACWLAVRGRRPWVRYANWTMLLFLLLGLYSSGSRGATVAAVTSLGISALMFPTLRRRIHWYAAGMGVVASALLLAIPSFADTVLRTTRIASSQSTEISDVGRAEVFQQGMADLRASPLYGIGVRYIAEAHVTYIGMLAAGGLLLFVAFLAMNLGALRVARRTYAFDPSLGGAMLVSLLAALVYWTVAVDFAVASVEVIYGFVIAAEIVARREMTARQVREGDDDAEPSQAIPAGRGVVEPRHSGMRAWV